MTGRDWTILAGLAAGVWLVSVVGRRPSVDGPGLAALPDVEITSPGWGLGVAATPDVS